MNTQAKPGFWRKTVNGRTAILYLLPSILLFSVFVFYPMFRTIYLSLFLTDQTGNAALFVGFENYGYLLGVFRIPQQYESDGIIRPIYRANRYYPLALFCSVGQ